MCQRRLTCHKYRLESLSTAAFHPGMIDNAPVVVFFAEIYVQMLSNYVAASNDTSILERALPLAEVSYLRALMIISH